MFKAITHRATKKNIPLACQKRLSLLSSNEDIFNTVAPQYQDALDKAGHKHKLMYNPTAVIGTKGKRYRSKLDGTLFQMVH